MKRSEREKWEINITNLAAEIIDAGRKDIVDSTFKKYEAMDTKIPDSGRIVEMLKYDELEKDVAEELGIAKTTLNYRKKKVIAFLREHLKDFI